MAAARPAHLPIRGRLTAWYLPLPGLRLAALRGFLLLRLNANLVGPLWRESSRSCCHRTAGAGRRGRRHGHVATARAGPGAGMRPAQRLQASVWLPEHERPHVLATGPAGRAEILVIASAMEGVDESHGGHIEAASERGVGSTFTVSLALHPPPQPR